MSFNAAEKAFCVLTFHESKSPYTVQCNFRRKYVKDAPKTISILTWYKQFKNYGCLCKKRHGLSEEPVQKFHQRKSLPSENKDLNSHITNMYNYMHPSLCETNQNDDMEVEESPVKETDDEKVNKYDKNYLERKEMQVLEISEEDADDEDSDLSFHYTRGNFYNTPPKKIFTP